MIKSVGVGCIICCLLIGCKTGNSETDEIIPAKKSISGFETTITCRAGIKEELNVSIVTENNKEDFGVIGALPERDGGKTVGFSPLAIGEKVTVKWGLTGQDFLEQTHACIFDTTPFLACKDQIKSVEYIYHGEGKWELKAFDKSYAFDDRKEVCESLKNY